MASDTVFTAFRATAERWPDNPFLHILPETAGYYGIEPGTIPYGEALAVVERLAGAYREAGYGHGHRVGLLLENRPAFFLHWLALNALGAGVVPINAELRAAELEYLIGHSELCAAVTLPDRRADLESAAARAGRAVALFGPDGAVAPAPEPPPKAGQAVALFGPDEGSECALLYTSGTTGRPKGCVLPNAYFTGAGRWYNAIGGLCSLRPGVERLITPLPMVHMNAMAYSTMAMVMSGGCIVPLDRFHPKSWWASVRESGATICHYLGVMPSMLMKAPAGPDDRAHALRFGFGAGIDGRLHAAFEERFGFPLLEAWAMTETGAGAVVIANHEPRKVGTACFGRPEPAVDIRLVDDEGRDVPDGQPGELLVRAAGDDPRAGFFAEYLKDPEATHEAWEGGYFHTGDLVLRDGDGHLHFVDRKKNVIRRSGENIAAVEVESVLRRHPLVREVAVAATPDPVRGDEVLACVIPAEPLADERLAEAAGAIVDYCLDELAYYKAPGYVVFVEALPLTATQKISRGELKTLARDLPQSPRAVDTRSLKKRR